MGSVLHFLTFEWDPKKAAANLKKHRVSFEEASSVFIDPLAIIDHDQVMASRESILGRSLRQRELYVVFVETRPDRVRLVSARRATKAERCRYETGF